MKAQIQEEQERFGQVCNELDSRINAIADHVTKQDSVFETRINELQKITKAEVDEALQELSTWKTSTSDEIEKMRESLTRQYESGCCCCSMLT